MKRKIQILFLVLIAVWFFYTAIKLTVENVKLSRTGIETTGIVISVKDVSKGQTIYNFTFKAKEGDYDGILRTGKGNKYKTGDSIEIIYLEDNPRVNRELGFIRENY